MIRYAEIFGKAWRVTSQQKILWVAGTLNSLLNTAAVLLFGVCVAFFLGFRWENFGLSLHRELTRSLFVETKPFFFIETLPIGLLALLLLILLSFYYFGNLGKITLLSSSYSFFEKNTSLDFDAFWYKSRTFLKRFLWLDVLFIPVFLLLLWFAFAGNSFLWTLPSWLKLLLMTVLATLFTFLWVWLEIAKVAIVIDNLTWREGLQKSFDIYWQKTTNLLLALFIIDVGLEIAALLFLGLTVVVLTLFSSFVLATSNFTVILLWFFSLTPLIFAWFCLGNGLAHTFQQAATVALYEQINDLINKTRMAKEFAAAKKTAAEEF